MIYFFFIPNVGKKLQQMELQGKAILLIDNCRRPDESGLIPDDSLIIAKFLPPNISSLIQPIDQGVLEALKGRYRRTSLHLEEDKYIVVFLKGVTMVKVFEKIAIAWHQVTLQTIMRT